MRIRRLARIDAGVVVEILEAKLDPSQLFHSSLQFIDVTDQTTVGLNWRYDGSVFTPPIAVPLVTPSVPAMSDLKAQIDLLSEQFALLSEKI